MEEDSDTIRSYLDSPVLHEELQKARHIRLCPDASPSVEDIFEEVQAYIEVYGQPPALILVDNLVDITIDDESGNGWSGVRHIVAALHDLARETEAHVMVLAHVTGIYDNGDKPIPLNGLEFKPAKVVELVLSITRDDDEMRVYPIKNTDGIANASAGLYVSLRAEMNTMQIREYADA